MSTGLLSRDKTYCKELKYIQCKLYVVLQIMKNYVKMCKHRTRVWGRKICFCAEGQTHTELVSHHHYGLGLLDLMKSNSHMGCEIIGLKHGYGAIIISREKSGTVQS